MTRAERRILTHLAEHGPAQGLDLVRAGCASRGAVYVLLSRLEDDGLVDSWLADAPQGGTLPRRRYRITSVGRRVLS